RSAGKSRDMLTPPSKASPRSRWSWAASSLTFVATRAIAATMISWWQRHRTGTQPPDLPAGQDSPRDAGSGPGAPVGDQSNALLLVVVLTLVVVPLVVIVLRVGGR